MLKYPRGADADLDGKVDDNDVTLVGAQYMQVGSGQWYLGDFDYDGMCDDDDVTVLGALYDPSAPPLSASYLSATYGEEFAAAWEAGVAMRATLPEPGSAWVIILAVLGGSRRARRRSL